MVLTEYDKANVSKIILGEGDWFTAHLLRFLDTVLFKADTENLMKLWRAYPDHCSLIYRTYGWSEKEITNHIVRAQEFVDYYGDK